MAGVDLLSLADLLWCLGPSVLLVKTLRLTGVHWAFFQRRSFMTKDDGCWRELQFYE